MTLAEMLFYTEDRIHREIELTTRPITIADVTAVIEHALVHGKPL
jgi:hypothetical protein